MPMGTELLSPAVRASYVAARQVIERILGETAAVAPKVLKLPKETWIRRILSSVIEWAIVIEVVDFFKWFFSSIASIIGFEFAQAFPNQSLWALSLVADQITAGTPIATQLSLETIRAITGVEITPEQMEVAASPHVGRLHTVAIGNAFLPVVSQLFDLESAAADFTNRVDNHGSFENMAAFFGTNLTFGLRSLAISATADIFGWPSVKHLEGLHQTINWAFGFGWLSWAIMSPLVQIAMTKRVTEYYNSRIRPNDLSDTEAYKAYLEGRIPTELWAQVLNNTGERDDIRDIKLDMLEDRLTLADVEMRFQRGLMTEEDVTAYFRSQGFRPERATIKSEMVTSKRIEQLREEYGDVVRRLFQDGLVTEAACRQWFASLGYTGQEVDMVITIEVGKRQFRQFLTSEDMNAAIDNGWMSSSEVSSYLTFQGMTPIDAQIRLLRFLTNRLPSQVKSCFEKVSRNGITDALSFIQSIITDPTLLANVNAQQIVKCFSTLSGGIGGGGTEGADGAAGPVPPPTIHKFTVRPTSLKVGDEYALEWEVVNADRVTFDPDIGRTDLAGAVVLRAESSHVLTLSAIGSGGTITEQRAIVVKSP